MTELAVGGAGDHFTVDGAEFLYTLTERDDLGGTYERAASDTRTQLDKFKHINKKMRNNTKQMTVNNQF